MIFIDILTVFSRRNASVLSPVTHTLSFDGIILMQMNIKLYLAILIPLILMLIPLSWIPIDGITIVEQRVIAIFVLAALFWILEPVPIYATSILITVLLLITVSDKSLILFRQSAGDPAFGTLLKYQDIMATFASPIIMLFLGGFFLAMAATKFRLDMNLARVFLKPFGSNPKYVLMGIMSITAMFSMFMSNTATTAMMLALLAPVLALFNLNDRGKIAFALAVPFAANIGGIGTIIGTPPNAIGIKYLTGDNAIGFGQWMAFALPFVIIMLLIIWFLLLRTYPVETERINLDIGGKFLKNWKAITVYSTFVITILLWLTDFLHGMNSYIVAMIPVAVFTTTTIITKDDLRNISWDVLWLVAGGIALGLALENSGLAKNLIESIPFERYAPLIIVAGAGLLTILMSNFISNTATANLLMPIMVALGTSVPGIADIGGPRFIILIVTFSASLGMALPISTPPNALAHGSGFFKTNDMARIGIIIGIIGLSFAYVYLYLLTAIIDIL
jgi:solute carrier family 13 (sodium-dependent dicarboxylate transporter), member 2/3/5